MKVIMVHNTHLFPGGEDRSFALESDLLRKHNHQVIPYERNNKIIAHTPLWKIGLRSLWSQEDYDAVLKLIRKCRPDILHAQNTFPLISPSIYYAAQRENVPVVMSLRNYRLYCLNAYFFRDGKACELCVDQLIPLSGIKHRCYQNSLPGSLVTASMLTFHRLLKVYERQVNTFIVLTEFAREKFISYGIPARKLRLKPNFLDDDVPLNSCRENFALFSGRLSAEKGIEVLLQAWKDIGQKLPLKIAGSGPLEPMVRQLADIQDGIEYIGQKTNDQILSLLRRASVLVFPSLWYEGMPRIIIEAFATGTPVVGSNLGAMSTLIEHGKTGIHFRAGDAQDLVRAVSWVRDHPDNWDVMHRSTRLEFEEKYSSDINYDLLIDIYKQTINEYSGL
ncbi:MAG: glycosyltransferase [Leptolyngbyaceae cyanobacterium]